MEPKVGKKAPCRLYNLSYHKFITFAFYFINQYYLTTYLYGLPPFFDLILNKSIKISFPNPHKDHFANMATQNILHGPLNYSIFLTPFSSHSPFSKIYIREIMQQNAHIPAIALIVTSTTQMAPFLFFLFPFLGLSCKYTKPCT